jgi:hypothetical protein
MKFKNRIYFTDDLLQDLKKDPLQDMDQDFNNIFLVIIYEKNKLNI